MSKRENNKNIFQGQHSEFLLFREQRGGLDLYLCICVFLCMGVILIISPDSKGWYHDYSIKAEVLVIVYLGEISPSAVLKRQRQRQAEAIPTRLCKIKKGCREGKEVRPSREIGGMTLKMITRLRLERGQDPVGIFSPFTAPSGF